MNNAADLSRRLAGQAEAVCSAYLPRGRRRGSYWIVGDVQGNPGQSLFVRLVGERRGYWLDAATAEHGDLLDLIRLARGFADFRSTMEEARRFLREPTLVRKPESLLLRRQTGTPAAAARLHALSQPLTGTIAETYLRRRRITATLSWPSLRFHPTCFYRLDKDDSREEWPALLGVVTDERGKLFGLQRTWLARDGGGKAPLSEPRRAMGNLLGHGVRFGTADDIMAAGEGIETVLSLLSLFPAMPMAAGLSAAHLSALVLPKSLRRLYLLRENDASGAFAEKRLGQRCNDAGIELMVLTSIAKDLNIDLCEAPAHVVKARIVSQMAPEDRIRFAA
ncbi:MAG: toprim domain-containing protein [Rhodomicrobium sp.]